MSLYIVTETSSGRRLRESSTGSLVDVEPVDPNSETLVTDDTRDLPPSDATHVWNTVALRYDALAPAVLSRTLLSKREFRNRLGQTVRLAIVALRRSTDPNLAGVRDLLEDMKETLDSVPNVDLTNPDTIAGVNGLKSLGDMGLLPFTAADVTRVLTPSTVEQE